jgi:tRNA pseudouridine65 synthase
MAPLRFIYQDPYLVAIDKPAGMIVHAGREPEDAQWIAMKRVRDYLGARVFPVHRLDRPTSGVLLFALDSKTAGLAQQIFERRQIQKIYEAVVCGESPSHWICETPLATQMDMDSLHALTEFERVAFAGKKSFPADPELCLSLLKVTPRTGRFHQIRRHLLESSRPIVGDFRYAGMDRSFALGKILGTGTRMLLQAKSLEFVHPYTGEKLLIQAPPDDDILKCFPDRDEL